jgi:hypothetical protein
MYISLHDSLRLTEIIGLSLRSFVLSPDPNAIFKLDKVKKRKYTVVCL